MRFARSDMFHSLILWGSARVFYIKLIFIRDKTIQRSSELNKEVRGWARCSGNLHSHELPQIKLLFATYVSARFALTEIMQNKLSVWNTKLFLFSSSHSLSLSPAEPETHSEAESRYDYKCANESSENHCGIKNASCNYGVGHGRAYNFCCLRETFQLRAQMENFPLQQQQHESFSSCDNLSFEGTPGIIMSVGTKAFNCN